MQIWNHIEKMSKRIAFKVLGKWFTEERWNAVWQFVQFGMVGLSNTIISYITYVVLVSVGFHYLLASLMGFMASVINAYYWNNKYVFKQQDGEERNWWRSFLKTVSAYAGTGLILNSILLIIWVDFLGVQANLGPILNLFITIPLNYVLNKYWAFRKK